MALVFPAAPTLGQQYPTVDPEWEFDGVGWVPYSIDVQTALAQRVDLTTAQSIDGPKTFTDDVRIMRGANSGGLKISSEVGQYADVMLEVAGLSRWSLRATNAVESGGDTGTTFQLKAFHDDGTIAHNVFQVERATGILDFKYAPTVAGAQVAVPTSGEYTPTITNFSNVASSAAYPCSWQRVGNMVTVIGRVDVTCTANAASTIVRLSLPIASAFTNERQLGGSIASTVASAIGSTPVVYGLEDGVNGGADIRYVSGSSATASRAMFFTFTYRVI